MNNISLSSHMVRQEPSILDYLPFGPDENNKIVFVDYQGALTYDLSPQILFPQAAQPTPSSGNPSAQASGPPVASEAGTPRVEGAEEHEKEEEQEDQKKRRFLLFRDRFVLPEDRLFLVPKMYTNVPGFPRIRLINNDTLQEMPIVFGRLMPQSYRKNTVSTEAILCIFPTIYILQAITWIINLTLAIS